MPLLPPRPPLHGIRRPPRPAASPRHEPRSASTARHHGTRHGRLGRPPSSTRPPSQALRAHALRRRPGGRLHGRGQRGQPPASIPTAGLPPCSAPSSSRQLRRLRGRVQVAHDAGELPDMATLPHSHSAAAPTSGGLDAHELFGQMSKQTQEHMDNQENYMMNMINDDHQPHFFQIEDQYSLMAEPTPTSQKKGT